MTKVTREFSFEAAHMLSGYNGMCQNLHGHSYKLQITVEGAPKNNPKLPDNEMVMDFSDLKKLVNDKVISKLDHALIFSSKEFRHPAEEDLYKWAQIYTMRHIVLNGRSTAETITAWIRSRLINQLGEGVHVRLWETEKSFAEV